ncbi:hypothetical protein LCGC14_1241540 [marine sediment metagenome]|uniref:Uncharacterized protein n=1 Tax=marine sediment metagenome TaxID=412755 RepID=A0A0F9LSX2_9ZZZZ
MRYNIWMIGGLEGLMLVLIIRLIVLIVQPFESIFSDQVAVLMFLLAWVLFNQLNSGDDD